MKQLAAHQRRECRGYKPDGPNVQKRDFAHLRATFAASLPTAVDLRAFAPDVFDQGQTGSCTGHAIGGAVTCALAKAEMPLGFVASPDFIYKLERCLERVSREPLTDSGAMPDDGIRAISRYGVVRMRGPTSDGRNSDVELDGVNDEPDFGSFEAGAKKLIVGAYAILSTGKQRARDVAWALAHGFTVPVAVSASNDTWQGWEPSDGPLGAQHPVELDHYVYIVGYRMDAEGNFTFIIRNSWGTEWGDGGDIETTEAFLDQCGDLYAMQITTEEAA